MNRQIFVNLPVKNLDKSVAFFKSLGYSFNPQFTDDTAACLVINDGSIYAMLLTHDKFKYFSPSDICDTDKNIEVLICLSCENRDAVDELVRKAVAAGGHSYKEPMDYGFMYGHNFKDLDGHCWELMYMDPSHIQK
jgi:uncharacterized protein